MADTSHPHPLTALWHWLTAPSPARTGPPRRPVPGGPVLMGDLSVSVNGRPALLDQVPLPPRAEPAPRR